MKISIRKEDFIMDVFEALFGIKKEQVKQTCIVMPLVTKETIKLLEIGPLRHGRLYSAGNTEHATFIRTGVGPTFVGDAVLYLEKTSCKNVILYGSCGLLESAPNLDIGSLVLPHTCYALESFSKMLSYQDICLDGYYPDKELYQSFSNLDKEEHLSDTICASLGSLKLEDQFKDLLQQLSVQIVDMECSAFFSAARFVKKRALAFFYVNDIIGEKPFYEQYSAEDKQRLSKGIQLGLQTLREFVLV